MHVFAASPAHKLEAAFGRPSPPFVDSIMCAGEATKTCININKHALHMYVYAYNLYIPVLSLIYPLYPLLSPYLLLAK